MYSVSLQHANHERVYSVAFVPETGWEIKSEEDRKLTRHLWCRDWHRVERMLELFRRDVADLTAQGWKIQSTKR